MALQDLTPQLRTRLSKVERAVGVFVIIATLLLLAGLAFYIYSTAQRKGWLKMKFNYHIYLKGGEGIRAGDVLQVDVEAVPGEHASFFGHPQRETIGDHIAVGDADLLRRPRGGGGSRGRNRRRLRGR